MKASEAIARLIELTSEHGDIEIAVRAPMGDDLYLVEARSIDVREVKPYEVFGSHLLPKALIVEWE